MKLIDFDYHLPPELIAQTPAEPRDSARLLCLDKETGNIEDKVFRDIADMLCENDVLVVNETRVIKARLKGFIKRPVSADRSQDLKGCEIFLHKQISENTWDCLVYPGKKLKPGAMVMFKTSPNLSLVRRGKKQILPLNKGELEGVIKEISDKGRIVEFNLSGQAFLDAVEHIGEIPLPPYIKDSDAPDERYQTVYHDSEKSGSVAAPTAGLHFTPELIKKLKNRGVQFEKVCLHVGLGTFANVEVENITDHSMHSERAYIDKDVSVRLNLAKQNGKRIIAVGTTSVRTLESFSDSSGHLGHGYIDTEIFIYPGYTWKFVESIFTNFHLPKSTLVMLVSSFAGDENRKKAYQHAVDSQYRFFSFGDSMWIQ